MSDQPAQKPGSGVAAAAKYFGKQPGQSLQEFSREWNALTDDDKARGAAISHLMCNAELPFDMFVGDVNALVDIYEQFAKDGLVEFRADKLCVTSLGRFFLRNLAFPLDAYRGATDGVRRFSHAV